MQDKEQEGTKAQETKQPFVTWKIRTPKTDTVAFGPYELIEIGPSHLGEGSDCPEWI